MTTQKNKSESACLPLDEAHALTSKIDQYILNVYEASEKIRKIYEGEQKFTVETITDFHSASLTLVQFTSVTFRTLEELNKKLRQLESHKEWQTLTEQLSDNILLMPQLYAEAMDMKKKIDSWIKDAGLGRGRE